MADTQPNLLYWQMRLSAARKASDKDKIIEALEGKITTLQHRADNHSGLFMGVPIHILNRHIAARASENEGS